MRPQRYLTRAVYSTTPYTPLAFEMQRARYFQDTIRRVKKVQRVALAPVVHDDLPETRITETIV